MNDFKPTRLMTKSNFINRIAGLDGSMPYRLKIGMAASVLPSITKAYLVAKTDVSSDTINIAATSLETVGRLVMDRRGKKFYKWYEHVTMFAMTYRSNKKRIAKLKGENLLSPTFQEELEEIMKGVKLNLDERHTTTD